MLTRHFLGTFTTTTKLLTSQNSKNVITRQNSKPPNFEQMVKIK
eukprot:UN10174